ncbi:effector-associated domain EAD1-containing protein [Nocardioides sp. NPDC057767]|uniref:phosphorylase family protein n=1 Tax=unclassified Nocardioides TaxID=2615069 RepID=UPI003670233C
MTSTDINVLVVTALKLERLAVREHLADVETENASGLAADIGSSVSSPGQRIAIIETGPGNVSAGILTAKAEETFRPEYIVMFGIAGGVKDVAIGDVVASSKVYWVEGGKAADKLKPRPDFATVSPSVLQLARAVSADNAWMGRATSNGGTWPGTGREPDSFVGPIVVGEKVVIDQRAEVAQIISQTFSDAIAVDMEDFGALRGGAANERAKTIAIRGISDLMAHKADADAGGSQPLAAANGAAFLFDLLDRLASSTMVAAAEAVAPPTTNRVNQLVSVARKLYPGGPEQDALWERAGGDPSRLNREGAGATRWWHAIQLLENGGGGNITVDTLLAQMRSDYTNNDDLNGLN